MGFSTQECDWSKVSVSILGVKLQGLKGLEVSKSVEKEYLYGSSDEPIDITSGNKSYPGSLKILKYELDKMNEAAIVAGYEDITEVPHSLIVATIEFKKAANTPRRVMVVPAVSFTELKYAMSQGDKFMEVDLPFLGMGLKNVVTA
jgi:hypothetical protein